MVTATIKPPVPTKPIVCIEMDYETAQVLRTVVGCLTGTCSPGHPRAMMDEVWAALGFLHKPIADISVTSGMRIEWRKPVVNPIFDEDYKYKTNQ